MRAARAARGLADGLRDAGRALVHASSWRMAGRNVRRHPRRTLIVLSAVGIGLGGLLLTMALNYGMVLQMVRTAIGTGLGHVQVHAEGYAEDPDLARLLTAPQALGAALEEVRAVRAFAPRVRHDGLLFSSRSSVGVRVLGVDPAREAAVSVLPGSIRSGAFPAADGRRIALGERLARRLQVGVGDKVVLSVQDLAGDLTGEAYRVAGLFRTASRALDDGTVVMPLAESQRLLGLGGAVSELVLIARDMERVDALRTGLAERLGPGVEVRSWKELRPLLVQMIEVFDSTGWMVYAAVFVAMAFGIANVLLMSVFERFREIGILMALGMPPGWLVTSVALESLLLTGAGVALGLALGLGGVAALSDGIDLGRFATELSAYGIEPRIVPVVRAADLLDPVGVALATALLASLWPALRAVRVRPAEAVRHT